MTGRDGAGGAGEEGPAGRGWGHPVAAASLRRRIGLPVGPAAFLAILLLPPPAGLEPAAWRTAGAGLLMAIWWLTEAIPIPATALVPLVLFPLLGAGSIDEAARPYANPVIFLFLGGFLIALGMQRWRLHRRIALEILLRSGSRPGSLVAGFMASAAFLSMWVSNTATAMMMLPIGVSVIELLRGARGAGDGSDTGEGSRAGERSGGSEDRNFPVALMLGIAYAASIGGMGTLIGTPPNALLAGWARETRGVELGFLRWMMVGIPLVLVALPLAYLALTRIAYPLRRGEVRDGRRLIRRMLDEQGRMSRPEKAVGVVFGLTALLWMLRPLVGRWVPGLSDAGIAVAGGLSLFLIPVDLRRGRFVLNWDWAARLPWDILVLFGGGLSLAAAIDRTGLAAWLGEAAAGAAGWPPVAFILLITLVVVLLTELTSNTATAAAFIPILGSVGAAVAGDALLLAVPAALAASCAFMLPVATPPNAIVYGSHEVTIPQMARAGFLLNLLMVLLVTAVALALVPLVFGT